jgi:hypothetical protein
MIRCSSTGTAGWSDRLNYLTSQVAVPKYLTFLQLVLLSE